MSLIEEIRRRRVVQTLVGYIVGLWGGAQVIDFVEQRYLLSPSWLELFVLVYVTLLPGVIVFAWSKGAPERQAWSRISVGALLANVVLTVAVLGIGLSRMELGPVTETVVVENEEGETVELAVPRPAYRRSLTMSFPIGSDLAPEVRAAAMDFEFLLENDLAQNPFLQPRVPWHEQQRALRAGLPDATRMPRALVHEAARNNGTDFFMISKIEPSEIGHRFELQLIATEDGRPVARTSVEGADLFTLADQTSVWILEELEVPTEGIVDQPVSDVTTNSAEALRALTEGSERLIFDQDLEGGLESFRRAVEIDPTCALAHLSVYQTLISMGRQEESIAAIDETMKHSYRLNERTQFLARASYHGARNEIDKALAVLDMWSTMHPNDTSALAMIAMNRAMVQDDEGTIDAADRLLELAPGDVGAIQMAVNSARMIGAPELELRAARLWTEATPNEVAPYLALGGAQLNSQDLDGAEATFERALLLDPTNVDVQRKAADVRIRRGQFDDVRESLSVWLGPETPAADRARVLDVLTRLEQRAGRIDRALEHFEEWAEVSRTIQAPGGFAFLYSQRLDLYGADGRPEYAHEEVATLRTQLPPALSDLVALGSVEAALVEEDTVRAREELARFSELIETIGLGISRWNVEYLDAQICVLEDDPEGALAACDRVVELDPTRLLVGRVRAEALRMLERYDDALDAVDTQLAVDPSHPWALLERARVLRDAGRSDEAIASYESAVDVWKQADPDYEPAREARTELEALRTGS